MDRVPLKSSTIASIGYDDEHALLEIEFVNGAIYQYTNVPASIARGLLQSPSVGKYFDIHVKKAGYAYVQIR